MQKEFEKVAGPIRQKLEERQATLADLERKAAQAQAEVEAAQKEAEAALRAGNEAAYGTATERLTRAKTTQGYYSGRKNLLTAEPILDTAGHKEFEAQIKAILQADEAAALEKLKKIVTSIREINTTLNNSYDQAADCRKTGISAAGKEINFLEFLGDARIRQFCHMASSEFSRMFKF